MEDVNDALMSLKRSVDHQAEQQQNLIASVRELTEMLAHSIDATKELIESLNEAKTAKPRGGKR
jgi:hypothetical protein